MLKKRFGVGRKPRRVRSRAVESRIALGQAAGTSKLTRYVTAGVAREVYVRDGGQCTFCSTDGRRCHEKRMLQFDHVIPFAEGGGQAAANLRLRCRAHNLHAARQYFGSQYIAAVMERALSAG